MIRLTAVFILLLAITAGAHDSLVVKCDTSGSYNHLGERYLIRSIICDTIKVEHADDKPYRGFDGVYESADSISIIFPSIYLGGWIEYPTTHLTITIYSPSGNVLYADSGTTDMQGVHSRKYGGLTVYWFNRALSDIGSDTGIYYVDATSCNDTASVCESRFTSFAIITDIVHSPIVTMEPLYTNTPYTLIILPPEVDSIVCEKLWIPSVILNSCTWIIYSGTDSIYICDTLGTPTTICDTTWKDPKVMLVEVE